jgi:superfamily II DNA/RNA helicase
MGFDKFKLNKQLLRSINEAGYTNPTELQAKTLSRILGGQDIIAIGYEGSGKTTAYILGALNRFNYAPDGVPAVLILVPDKEQVMAVLAQFELLNKNKSISIVGLYVTPGLEAQKNALADGADIVVATPDRARDIYLKLGLNLNKIDLFIVDNADQIIKNGLQLPVAELANSITKCQHLVFSEVMHDRVEKMIAPFMKQPAIIEVEALAAAPMKTYAQLLYHVPNFGTKLNLLSLFLADDELFTKTVVFVNTQATAQKIYKALLHRLKAAVAFLNPHFFDDNGFTSLSAFKGDPGARVLIVTNERNDSLDTAGIPFLLHFELPDEKETFIKHVINHNPGNEDETLSITFATDMELGMVKKIEQAIGKKMPAAALPDDLLIEKTVKTKKAIEVKTETPLTGEAFHQKKAANAKTYNFSSGQKAKMNKKKNH